VIRVRVPCTTANMGPGFDVMGTALNLYNETTFEETEEGVVVYEGYRSKPGTSPSKNLIYTSYVGTMEICGRPVRGLKITGEERGIPISRGLGSSAACIASGVLAANRAMNDRLSESDVIEIATQMEGHPDNVVPAIVGGMTVSVREGGRVIYAKVPLPESLAFVAIVPGFRLGTKKARKVLPRGYARADCVHNIGRATLLVASLASGELSNLRTAMGDRLHQPYRLKLIRGAHRVLAIAKNLGSLAEYVSGAGPTLMALIEGHEKAASFEAALNGELARLPGGWTAIHLRPDLQGARVSDA
jgi:homoserine kinase